MSGIVSQSCVEVTMCRRNAGKVLKKRNKKGGTEKLRVKRKEIKDRRGIEKEKERSEGKQRKEKKIRRGRFKLTRKK